MTAKNPAAVALGRLGGKVTSDAKAAAARKNGKRGGRPALCGVSAKDHNSTGLVFRCTLLRGHPGDHLDEPARRGWQKRNRRTKR